MVAAYQWAANAVKAVASGISNSWNFMKNSASSAINNTVDFFKKLPGRIVSAVGNLGHLLYQGGLDVVNGLWNGIKSVWNSVYGWFKGLPGKILHALGIASPPTWAIDAGKHIMNGILMSLVKGGGAVKNYFVGLAKDVGGPLAKTWSSIYGGSLMGGNKTPATGSLQQYAMSLLNSLGWGNQWPMFNALVMGESGWNPHAQNPGSGAYGIPQALPASKMASAGSDWATSGFTQLRWMMSYIGSVYGDPAHAYSSWLGRSPHWYDTGGWLPRGLSLAMNATGRPERILGPNEPIGGTTVVNNITVNVHGHALSSKQEIGRVVSDALTDFGKKGGSVPWDSRNQRGKRP